MLDDVSKEKALSRLKKIEGQIRGISRMVDDKQYCIDILTQISAASAALSNVAKLILKEHVETCVTDALRSGKEKRKIDELMDVIFKFKNTT
ncbi:MAG: metal-sensitive transcriptional regulator [Candidatus Schekmanbacteria bacterium]|nr:metal-sensitive transcriptional regulator [Candidatus Schekmanbacteria bacterium]